MIYRANDKYRAQLTSTWLYDPADGSIEVSAIPDNVPTLVVVGWQTDFETVFAVTGVSGTSTADYALTGVTRLRGAEEDIPENTTVNCLNNMEFINQYATYLGINWRGAWDSGTAYAIDDGVENDGSSYMAIAATTGDEPPDTDYWQLVVSKGDTGATGETGATGAAGSVDAASSITLTEISTPSNPSASTLKLYAKSDDKAYKLNSSGDEEEIVTKTDTQTLTNKTLTNPVINGQVTGDRPYFSAKLTTSGQSASCTLVWNSEITDSGGNYDHTTGRFTAPTDGFYIFGFNILLPNAGSGEYRVGFYKNGSIYDVSIWRKPSASTWETISGNAGVYLEEDDYIDVRYTQGSGDIYTDQNYNLFWGFRMM